MKSICSLFLCDNLSIVNTQVPIELNKKCKLHKKLIVDKSNNKIKTSNTLNLTINYISDNYLIAKELNAIKNAEKITQDIEVVRNKDEFYKKM